MDKTVTYVVKGHWPFPVDMLRHDQSTPATPADAEMVTLLSGDHAPDRAAFKDVEITLTGPSRPNTARWESFRWEVPSDELHAYYKAEARRRIHEDALFRGALAKLTDDERAVVLARTTTCH